MYIVINYIRVAIDSRNHLCVLGLCNIENSLLPLLQHRHHDYCCNTALEYFTKINRAQHHQICVVLETAMASGMKPL